MHHIEIFTAERIFYNDCIKTAKVSIAASNLQPGAHEVNTNNNDMTTHHVFDCSQMFSVRSFSSTSWPIIFYHPKKNSMFWYMQFFDSSAD